MTKEELARHCRGRTRGAEVTMGLIESLLLSLSTSTDTMGVPLLKGEEIKQIWEEQKQHIKCLQDPPVIQLYTVTGSTTKDGVVLPILICARGSTSLESFHFHLARFILGTSACAVNYQAYLVEGITRWNTARAEAAISSNPQTLRTFDARLEAKVGLSSYDY